MIPALCSVPVSVKTEVAVSLDLNWCTTINREFLVLMKADMNLNINVSCPLHYSKEISFLPIYFK